MKRFGRRILSVGMVVAGIASAAFGLKGFLLSSHFIDGGVTGISMLISDVFHLPLSILILLINLPFVAVGYRLTIISVKSQDIKDAIVNQLHRGVTVYHSQGGMGSMDEGHEEQEILYCVVTRLEIGTIKSAVKEIDPQAFITTNALADVEGGLIRKPAFH